MAETIRWVVRDSMAKHVSNPIVGMYVYRPYEAQNPGKIKQLLPPNTPLTNPSIVLGTGAFGGPNISIPNMVVGVPVEVAWYDGTTSVEDSHILNDFDALIADHKKKLGTHTSKLKKLGAL